MSEPIYFQVFRQRRPAMSAYVICPRECPKRLASHCLGPVENGRARCVFCKRFMPMDEAIDWSPDE